MMVQLTLSFVTDLTHVPDRLLLTEYGRTECQRSFAELHDRYAKPLCQFVRRKFHFDRETARDVAQHAWLSLSRACRHSIGSVWSYLQKIAYNEAIRHLRPVEKTLASEAINEIVSTGETAISHAILVEEMALTRAHLATLPKAQQRVLVLVFGDGISPQEACARLHICLKTVRNYISAAKRAIKSLLAAWV